MYWLFFTIDSARICKSRSYDIRENGDSSRPSCCTTYKGDMYNILFAPGNHGSRFSSPSVYTKRDIGYQTDKYFASIDISTWCQGKDITLHPKIQLPYKYLIEQGQLVGYVWDDVTTVDNIKCLGHVTPFRGIAELKLYVLKYMYSKASLVRLEV